MQERFARGGERESLLAWRSSTGRFERGGHYEAAYDSTSYWIAVLPRHCVSVMKVRLFAHLYTADETILIRMNDVNTRYEGKQSGCFRV